MITQERPKQRHLKQRDTKTGSSPMAILDFSSAALQPLQQTLHNCCSFALPLREISTNRAQQPAPPLNIKAVHRLTAWYAVQPRCKGRPRTLAAQLCGLPGGQSLPTVPLCSLLTPAQKNGGLLVSNCCRLAKGNEGLFYLYL